MHGTLFFYILLFTSELLQEASCLFNFKKYAPGYLNPL